MLRWVLLAVLVVALSATATVVVQTLPSDASVVPGSKYPAPPEAAGPQPKAVVEGDLVYRFGSKSQQTKFDKEWVIKNEGKADLALNLEAPPCSCTVAGFQKENRELTGTSVVVPPGGQTSIHFTWETREYLGQYHKAANILTNDPQRPRLEFVADGNIFPAIEVYPNRTIDFFEVSTDQEEHHLPFAFFSRNRPETKITRLSTSKPDLITAKHEPLPEEECKKLDVKAGYKITVTIKRGLPLAVFLEELVVGTDHPQEPEMRLTVTGKVVGPISLVPYRLRLVNIPGDTGGRGDITVVVRGQRETKFTIKEQPEKLKVAIAPSDNLPKAGKYRLSVTVPPGTPAGTIEGQVVLETDHPHAKQVIVPVYVLVH